MNRSHKRKSVATARTATLSAGVKVVPAPKSAARRKLLSGKDISASGGARTVHQHPVGSISK
jgi:hypothetical protein